MRQNQRSTPIAGPGPGRRHAVDSRFEPGSAVKEPILTTSPGPTVVVGVLTFRRPQSLARILPVLLAQAGELDPAADVLVVDNDPDAGARGPVADLAATWSGAAGLRYVHEPTPGIAAARNRALDEAHATVLVFIDDDEEPTPGWLAGLVACWQRSGAAAVTGPVEPRFETVPDAWIRASARFERRRLPTGTVVRSAASNNLLLDLRVTERMGLRFDVTFGLTGGEDTLFTHELVGRGGTIVWCDEAVVLDHIPPQRLTRRWVLRREFRSGTSWSRMSLARERRAATRPLVRADLVARGTVRVLAAVVRVGWGVVIRDVGHRARGSCLAAANAGLVTGALGHRYGEYRR